MAHPSERGQVLAWLAVLVAVVVVPLLALALEVPRWYAARQALQTGVDAAAAAAATLGWDTNAYADTGQVRFDEALASAVAQAAFAEAMSGQPSGTTPVLTAIQFDETVATVTVAAESHLTPWLPLVPAIQVRAAAAAQARTLDLPPP